MESWLSSQQNLHEGMDALSDGNSSGTPLWIFNHSWSDGGRIYGKGTDCSFESVLNDTDGEVSVWWRLMSMDGSWSSYEKQLLIPQSETGAFELSVNLLHQICVVYQSQIHAGRGGEFHSKCEIIKAGSKAGEHVQYAVSEIIADLSFDDDSIFGGSIADRSRETWWNDADFELITTSAYILPSSLAVASFLLVVIRLSKCQNFQKLFFRAQESLMHLQ
eukprot:gnl/MRDRNA2_/MRDRNA2_71411_c0_seq1.p1 gnl/MRDRNA2_/MRDRNA2_71411_c0~~gnl/MRDRNA2_/MRDRNA2_71411_c0_seq1.p1  ORF type:complete len:219 (-),score=33.69 gnl/MRDRNA2_/MRDRNA2_71411_c0_seq1:294-950(-)